MREKRQQLKLISKKKFQHMFEIIEYPNFGSENYFIADD